MKLEFTCPQCLIDVEQKGLCEKCAEKFIGKKCGVCNKPSSISPCRTCVYYKREPDLQRKGWQLFGVKKK